MHQANPRVRGFAEFEKYILSFSMMCKDDILWKVNLGEGDTLASIELPRDV